MPLSWNEPATAAFTMACSFGTVFLFPASLIVIGDFNSGDQLRMKIQRFFGRILRRQNISRDAFRQSLYRARFRQLVSRNVQRRGLSRCVSAWTTQSHCATTGRNRMQRKSDRSFDLHTTVYTDAVVIKIEITGADADTRALAERSVIEAVKNLSN